MPVYEYKCRRCGAVSEYLEKQGEWHLLPRKCRQCGRRRTSKVVSSFSSSVRRSRTETLNELAQMGNVRFAPRTPGRDLNGAPAGGCPYANAEPAGKQETGPEKKGPLIHADQG